MKRILLSALAIAAISVSSFAQTADEVINKHLDAIGGAAKWKTIKTVVMDGNLNIQGMEIPIKTYAVNNQGFRTEFTFQGQTGYQIVTPTEGWNFNPFMGQQKAEPMTADDIMNQSSALDVQGTLVDYAAKGHKVEFLGKEDVEGTECFKLKLTMKNGKEEVMFIDPSTYYIIRTVSKVKANGVEQDAATDLSSYTKTADGFVFPMSIGTPMGALSITTVKVNENVDASLFKPAK